jgi:hypothetical protein
VLKSIWLEGKRNRRVDHLIHTLVSGFLPDLEFRHKRQTLGMEGPNLAEKRRRQILRRAPETPVEKIQKIDDSRFEVQSSVDSNKFYHIDLGTKSCNCIDFPRVHLCKHIAAVVHFFGGADLGPRPPDNDNASASESDASELPVQENGSDATRTTDDGATASFVSAANDMIRMTQELISNAPQDPAIAKSFTKSVNSITSRLDALVHSATAAGDGSHFPEKENIGPNQLSWPETAAQMGVKRANKGKGGKVDSALTAQHIGEPNRKHAADYDPYGAGEQSGKRARPDARSAAANARARCAAEERAVLKAEPPPTLPPPPTPLPPPTLPLPMLPPTPLPPASFPPYTYNPFYFHPSPAPLSQSMYSYSQGPPSASPYYPASTYSHQYHRS